MALTSRSTLPTPTPRNHTPGADVIKTRLQVQQRVRATHSPEHHYTSVLDALHKILEHEGVAGLYTGYPAATLGTLASSFSYFYAYAAVRGGYVQRLQRQVEGSGASAARLEVGTGMELLLGAMAGALSQLVTLPIAILTTRYGAGLGCARVRLKRVEVETRWGRGGPGMHACMHTMLMPASAHATPTQAANGHGAPVPPVHCPWHPGRGGAGRLLAGAAGLPPPLRQPGHHVWGV